MEISAKEQLVYDVLNGLEIEYKLFRHEAVFTVEAAADLDRRIGVKICKNLFLSSRHNTEFFFADNAGGQKVQYGQSFQIFRRAADDFCGRFKYGGVSQCNARFRNAAGAYKRQIRQGAFPYRQGSFGNGKNIRTPMCKHGYGFNKYKGSFGKSTAALRP